MTDPVAAYFAAVNAEDWAALAALWEPDAELVATGARPRRGRAAIVAYYPRVLEGYAEHEDRPVRCGGRWKVPDRPVHDREQFGRIATRTVHDHGAGAGWPGR